MDSISSQHYGHTRPAARVPHLSHRTSTHASLRGYGVDACASIKGGYYKIRNVEFDTQYVDLKQGNARPGTLIVGHREDNSPGGIQNRTWQILYQSKGPLTATIRNPVSASYATVDDLNGNVVGNGDPQEFELIKTSYGYRIKVKGSTDVWILDSKEDLTKIHVISPPSESDKKQYWILESS